VIIRIGLITALSFLTFSVAAAQELSTPPVTKIVLSGERTKVGWAFDVNPDCTATGEIRVRLIELPKTALLK
jgi:hypothetical protein